MTKFKKARPNSNVNLRSWEPGRVSQLKLMLSHLEQGVNTALAAQVLQDPGREFSEFVPKIPEQDITVEVSFREARIKFPPPKGLKRLLFYEYDVSTVSNFGTFERFQSPEPFFVFTNLQDFSTHYIRIRVVTTEAQVGPFSDTLTVETPLARSQVVIDKSLSATVLTTQ